MRDFEQEGPSDREVSLLLRSMKPRRCDEFPPLFVLSQQFLVDLCVFVIQNCNNLQHVVQQYLWSVSPRCTSMKFVLPKVWLVGLPCVWGLRSSSFSFDRCCHSFFIQVHLLLGSSIQSFCVNRSIRVQQTSGLTISRYFCAPSSCL